MTFSEKIIGAMLMSASITMAAPAYTAERALSAEELQTMITNASVEFSGWGLSGITSYGLDGRVSAELTIGISDEGVWWLEGNQVCTKWHRLRRGKASCFVIIHEGGEKYRTSHGYSISAL